MVKSILALLLSVAASVSDPDPPPDLATGTIQGVVMDGTRHGEPLEGVEVVLRAGRDGELITVAEAKTDRYGEFVFSNVPAEPGLVYKAGANREGVHYPGPGVQFDPLAKVAHITIVAYEATTGPNPLVATRHDIEVVAQPQLWKVTETVMIKNPTLRTYVGQPAADGSLVTLGLTIPQSFNRVTFAQEFYGRRFTIVDHRVVTDIPWPPGDRELKFTYCVPVGDGVFERPLDLPSGHVRLLLRGEQADEVSCNLPRAERPRRELMVFDSVGTTLPAGYKIALALATPPIPWTEYARWAALATFLSLVVLTVLVPCLRKSRTPREANTSTADRRGGKPETRPAGERRPGRHDSGSRAA